MDMFTVKTNKVTFKILQKFALENGYRWVESGNEKKEFDSDFPLLEFISDNTMVRSTSCGVKYTNVVSLEEKKLLMIKKLKSGSMLIFMVIIIPNLLIVIGRWG